jgi:nucleoside-diphosphate-sugar epimerase
MNDTQRLAILESLEISSSAIADIDFKNRSFLVRGASGHFGIWGVLVLAQLAKKGKPLRIFCETSRYANLVYLLEQLGLTGKIQKATIDKKYDVVLDFSLPPQDFSRQIDFHFCKEVLSGFEGSLSRTKDEGILIIPSSGAVYGHHRFETGAINEVMSVSARDRGTYGEIKYLIEKLSAQVNDKRLPIFRIFSTFGPFFREDSELVTNRFFQQARKREDLQLYSKGIKLRNFAFIGELVAQMIYLAICKELDQSGPINLGCSENLSIFEFATKISNAFEIGLNEGSGAETFECYIPDLTKLESLSLPSSKNNTNQFIELTSKYYV